MLSFGLYPSQVESAYRNSKTDVLDVKKFVELLLSPQGIPNHFTLALLHRVGKKEFISYISRLYSAKSSDLAKQINVLTENFPESKLMLTGAEAFSLLLHTYGVTKLYAYPGTSELMLCDAVSRLASTELINGRGDKETAFMAAGSCLLHPLVGAALLHGARGGTNALGAIADAFRNEVGTTFFIGLPSTSSSPFLPPHGERKLIESLGNFVKWHAEITQVQTSAATCFVKSIINALTLPRELPLGPTLLGIPQDASEKRWIPLSLIPKEQEFLKTSEPSKSLMNQAGQQIRNKKHIVLFVDDPLFRRPHAKQVLAQFASHFGSPVFQVYQRRGPMLFETVSAKENPYFAGKYTVESTVHQKIMQQADLLITLEDRNEYERVIGKLPFCPKIAITSFPAMTKKNLYLGKQDMLLSGDPVVIMKHLIHGQPAHLTSKESALLQKACSDIRKAGEFKPNVTIKYMRMRTHIPKVMATFFMKQRAPLLVDDSQMFGGLLAHEYQQFPASLRVFGDHGAFIGGGLAVAAGLAGANEGQVLCTLGDQSFTNAIQGLVTIVEQQLPVIYLVCNNGRSVSLLKQITSQDPSAFDSGFGKFLYNSPHFSYFDLAVMMGLQSEKVSFLKRDSSDETCVRLERALNKFGKTKKPALIELLLPSDPEAWSGIWETKGMEVKKAKK